MSGQQGAISRTQYSYEENMKMYEVLMYKVFKQGDNMCDYGQIGDRFFIILQGEVSVLQPYEDERKFNALWDVYNFVVENHEKVRTYRDDQSKEIGHLVNVIGVQVFRTMDFKQVRKLIEFLRNLTYMDEEICTTHSISMRKIVSILPRIKNLIIKLKKQLNMIDETAKGSVSVELAENKKYQARFEMMQEVKVLHSGESFG